MGNKPSALDAFAQKQLEQHNHYRKLHDVTPLKLSKDLSKDAQAFAEKLASEGRLRHDTDCQLGENVFYSSKEPAGATDKWYSEHAAVDDYANLEQLTNKILHFTQVVWKESHVMGVGMAQGKTGYYVVARYMPAGNHRGRFVDNVPPPKKSTDAAK